MKYKVIVTNLETEEEIFNEDVTLVILTAGNVGKDGLIKAHRLYMVVTKNWQE